MVVLFFNILRNLCTVFCSGCTNLHSHQQCTGAPFLPHFYRYLLFLVLLMTASLPGVRFWFAFPWRLVIVLSSIFSRVCQPLVCLLWNYFHHFKIDSYLVTLSVFTVFCNDHIYLFPEHFCHPKKKQCLPNSNVSLLPLPLLVTTTLSVSVNLSLWALHTLSFCVWLFLLSVIFSRSIYVAIVCIRISFLFEAG